MWLLDTVYIRKKQIKILSPFDENEWLLNCVPQVGKHLLGEIYLCRLFK